MSETAYRDALTGLRSRVRELREDVERLRRRVGWLLWAGSDAALRAQIEELRRRCATSGTGAEVEDGDATTLAGEQAALQELARLYGAMIASAPEVKEALRALPADAPRADGFHTWPVRLSVLELDEVGLRLDAARMLEHIQRFDPPPRLEMGDDAVLRAEVRVDGAAIGLALLKRHDPRYRAPVIRFAAEVHLPRLVPRLDVRVMHALGTIAASLGLIVDRRTGDDAFDTAFQVDGPVEGALLLGPAVRAALYELREESHLRLRIGPGIARLEWEGTADVAKLDASLAALSALQAGALHVGG